MKLKRPDVESLLGGGKMNISPIDILHELPPPHSYFFDSRHWVFETIDGVLPFAVTTRIAANNQQYLLFYDETE